MLKIIHYFIKIRLRKLLSKEDTLGIGLVIGLYFCTGLLCYFKFEQLKNLLLLSFLSPVFYHFDRDDLDFLKIRKNYKLLLFVEYLIYCLPFYLVLVLKGEFLLTALFLFFYLIFVNIPKFNFRTIPYPFQLFNPFWHIVFRKYKLILFVPLAIGLIVMAELYNNENLIFGTFFILLFVACSPSFERENEEEIKINPFDAQKYLMLQLKNSLINTIYILIPVGICLLILSKFFMLLGFLAVILVVLFNILLKYLYFHNTFTHQIVFAIFIIFSFQLFGLPLLATPFLYKKAIRNLNTIKYANH